MTVHKELGARSRGICQPDPDFEKRAEIERRAQDQAYFYHEFDILRTKIRDIDDKLSTLLSWQEATENAKKTCET